MRSISFATDAAKFEKTAREALKEDFVSCNLITGLEGSKGFGFVTVRASRLAESIQRLGTVLCDGFRWEAAESRKSAPTEELADLDTPKLIVKNLAF